MIKQAIIIGCGGHAHVVAEALIRNNYSLLGFLDESFSSEQEYIYHAQLIGKPGSISQYEQDRIRVFIAQGEINKRRETFLWLQSMQYRMPSLVHPDSLLATDVKVGESNLICMGVKLAAEVEIGNACIINTGVIVDHESIIGDYTHLAPGVMIAGRSKIGKNVFVGMGAMISDGIEIGEGAVIGANAVVLNHIDAGSKVLGVH